MSDTQDPKLDDCGCCETEPPETPISNPPGQPQLKYRIDTQPTFFQRMVNALPHETIPPDSADRAAPRPLRALTARALDDPSIALLDAWATAADVLTFYQERIANEGFLRTATERRSVLELAREIGYELSPGVAASTDLAFTVEDAVGAPRETTVPVGTKVLSVPGPGEKPQTFETVEQIVARPEWNAFPPRRDDPEEVLPGLTDLFVDGLNTQLQVGDAVLFVGGDRATSVNSANWDLRILTAVQPDQANKRTRLVWNGGLNTSPVIGFDSQLGRTPTRVFAMRKRAQLFGHNAPEFRSLPFETKSSYLFTADPESTADVNQIVDWDDPALASLGFGLVDTSPEVSGRLDLDINAPKVTPGGWMALAAEPGGFSQASVPANTRALFPPVRLRPAPFPLALGEEVPDDPINTTVAPADPPVEAALFQVLDGPMITTRTGFAITSQVTRVVVDSPNRFDKSRNDFPLALNRLSRRTIQFFLESEELTLGLRPVVVPVDGKEEIPEIPDTSKIAFTGPTGNFLAVGLAVQGLRPGQKIALTGKRPNVKVVDPNTLAQRTKAYLESTGQNLEVLVPIVSTLQGFLQPPGADAAAGTPGGLQLIDPPGAREPLAGHSFELLDQLQDGPKVTDYGAAIPTKKWTLRSRTGAEGTAILPFFAVDSIPADPAGETIAEIRTIKAVFQGASRMLLQLEAPLQSIYDRGSLTISANVAGATHGETVPNEVLGNGDAAVANQTFAIKKPPLTYTSSPDTPSGGKSTLDVRVNNILWREVPRFFGASPDDQIYFLRRTDDGQTDVIFGDGKQGARLPTGGSNVVATYRTGIGLDGQVDARSLSLLGTRPLGVRGVVNPLAATGAAPPALIDDARVNAPLTVRTIDRVVSVADVEDFARSFSGIGKAQARLLWNGSKQVVHLTVGGADGDPIPPEAKLLKNLEDAIVLEGDPSLVLQTPIVTFERHFFRLTLQLEIDDRFEKNRVQDTVRSALLDAFSFARRSFGQPVNVAEILGLAQGVPGVIAASVAQLTDEVTSVTADQLIVEMAHFVPSNQPGVPGTIVPAQLLVINPAHLTIEDFVT